MSAPEFSRFDELVSRYLDDELAPAHAAELIALLSEPPLAARFLEMVRLNSVGNPAGETLFAWTEGTGWAKGGAVAWRLFDKDGNALSESGRADGVPVWSLPTAFAKTDSSFGIVY
jgi:hypothetical protein